MQTLKSKKSLPWDVAEKKIAEEIKWLRGAIDTFSNEEKGVAITCRECLMRKIAILIISGKIRASEIRKSPPLKNFWGIKNRKTMNKKKRPNKQHGSDWHMETMKKIENHFLSRGYQVVQEPNLYWGRADLGIYKKGKPDLLIEVGTTSFFKLWMNLEMMKNFIYLIVPDDDKLIEFFIYP